MSLFLFEWYFFSILEDNEGTETHLSYTFRLSTAKILLDLEDYDNSTKVKIEKIFYHAYKK